jgi:hypothetical protein
MKILSDKRNGKNKLIYTGYGEHRHTTEIADHSKLPERLFGMATDSNKFLEHFKREYDVLEKNFIVSEYSTSIKMQDYLKKKIRSLK